MENSIRPEGPNAAGIAGVRSRRPVIAIAGAGGAVGSRLAAMLPPEAALVGIVRHPAASGHAESMEWRTCDFFSQEEALHALAGVDTAIYLLHAGKPSAGLTQGTSRDLNALLAEHFAFAAAASGVGRIICLNGNTPPGAPRQRWAGNLQERREAEGILASHGVPLTIISAGGAEPLHAAAAICAALGYGADAGEDGTGEAVREASGQAECAHEADRRRDVRSVQRFSLPDGMDAEQAALHYVDWLSRIGRPLLRVDRNAAGECRIYAAGIPRPLLQLTERRQASASRCFAFGISGGLLSRKGTAGRGRLEFLLLPGSRECLAAIHDFIPSLPWLLYKSTQAQLHLLVMYAFGRHLKKWR
ncbi:MULTISPECIES: NAD(P)H-binding protein [unclassified Paenibacillus]|uniref:NAD(P)H-binding protein n=1 Tax=unclassified Paenibacillus TaxID=185978 RepID=UPI0009565954|nr:MULTISPECIES: NAD(P)H-binding protein [unclassified Paenibacillus]ASS65511.2 NAD(P)H-binding protein [Paenibacillus sp. RUD330]SIQ33733.1 NAD(P)H-binding [Paenibacillus sp. RU4X]SIQ55415.1 NAD(P)H-binding [Paenibacillus sp. RU4T]